MRMVSAKCHCMGGWMPRMPLLEKLAGCYSCDQFASCQSDGDKWCPHNLANTIAAAALTHSPPSP